MTVATPSILELDFDLTLCPVFILLTIKATGKTKLGNYKNSVEHCRFSNEKTEILVLVIWGHVQCALKCFTRTLGTHENFSVTSITSSEHFFILLNQLLNIRLLYLSIQANSCSRSTWRAGECARPRDACARFEKARGVRIASSD